MAFNSSGRRDLNSPALADIHPVVERLSRLRGCVSTQVIQPGGDSAKVGGGVWGPMGGGRSQGANPGPLPPLIMHLSCTNKLINLKSLKRNYS